MLRFENVMEELPSYFVRNLFLSVIIDLPLIYKTKRWLTHMLIT